jgi:hypothetical protein
LKALLAELNLRFMLPKKLSYASLGVGIGPYGYRFEDLLGALDRIAPITTLYGSYFLTEESQDGLF